MKRALLLILLLVACEAPDAVAPPQALDQAHHRTMLAGGLMELYLTRPGVDAATAEDPEMDDAIAALFDQAEATIDLSLYEFSRPLIIDALLRAHERGVLIRFAGDGDEYHDPGYEALAAVGIDLVLRKPRDRIMHNKFVVVDDRWVWTGSTNFSENGLGRNNNHGILIDSPELAEVYLGEFDQMDSGLFGRKKSPFDHGPEIVLGGETLDTWFSPEDGTHQALLNALDTADNRVFFLVFSYTRMDVAQKMVDLHNAGVQVVGVFDESQGRGRHSVDEFLAREGVPVFIDGNRNATGFAGGKLHHKLMIVDPLTTEPTAIVGSYNWSKSGSEYNDENLISIQGPETATAFLEEFCDRLEEATLHPEFGGERPDPCDGLLQPLRINEFLANPEGSDSGKEWVEIVNAGNSPVDLTGWSLADKLRTRHQFSSLVLGPAEFVMVGGGFDDSIQPAQAPSTGTLALTNSSEIIELIDPTGRVIDRVEYSSAVSGVTFNRQDDGGAAGDFVLHDTLGDGVESPGTRADGSVWGSTALINEALPNPVGPDSDNEWVELTNPGSVPVDLEGWTVGDATNPVRHVFEAGTILSPGELLVVFDGGDHPDVEGHLVASTGTLSLNNTSDTLFLTDAAGIVRDQVSWGSTTEGVSLNRSDDGFGGPFVDHDTLSASTSSPGTLADGADDVGNALLVVNEVLPNPDGTDAGNEYIEIVNLGAEPVDLGGWSVGDAINDSRHVFSSGTIVEAGAALLLYDSGDHGDAVLASSGSLSLTNSGDSVRLITPEGAEHSVATWTSASSGVSLNRAIDADPESPLAPHDDVGVGNQSPGLRADGGEW